MKMLRTARRLQSSALVGALLLGGLGSALSADLMVKLTGDQEVSPVTTSATGTGTIVIKPDKSVSGSITTVGIQGTMAHIHRASPGTNGPPIITLVKTSESVWSIPDGAMLSSRASRTAISTSTFTALRTQAAKYARS